ncbi:uncharacterized protein RCO7_09663 [Rhynchosporium graminicola]|uniref:Uncharacterized protein n=1 Tax=Rhynchosporium graminicola TaxID=2792576 RepID=A0A1E1L9D1_9HELO|nr:uncharacterized protein RCO7_09663 [Rhynchosporium commune]
MFRSDTSTSLMKLGLTALILSTTHAFIASPPFSPTAEHHRLSSKYPTTSYSETPVITIDSG